MKKQYKVLKNFKCNGVSKKAGDLLKEDEREKIGSKLGKQLVNDDFLQLESDNSEQDEDEMDEDESEQDEELETELPEFKLDEMDKPALLEYAKDLGLDIHGRTSEEKIKEQIQNHLAG